jgi:hypothetical protein
MLPSDGGGLFLSPIPKPPGDPAALSGGAATYTAAHGEIERNRVSLTRAAGQANGAIWTGSGASAFVGVTSDLASAYSLTSAALAQGASVLKTYAAELTTAQETAKQANAAIATNNDTASALLAAQSAAQTAQNNANSADNAATTAETHANANPHSASAKVAATSARNDATDAATTASNAWTKVNTLSSQWSTDYANATRLINLTQTQASQASSKAAAGFEAAASELGGKKPTPAKGGAQGVPGGSTWADLIGETADWNDKLGWGLNALGAFGAFVLSKAEVQFIDKTVGLAGAKGTWGDAFDSIEAGDSGWFGSGYYQKWDALNEAWAGRNGALGGLQDAVSPAGDAWKFMDVVGKGGLVLGMASDVITEFKPNASFGPDGLLGGNTDRVMAGLNLGASGLALGGTLGIDAAGVALAIPGVNVVVGAVLIGTAAYFAGEYVYAHWSSVVHLGQDAWHGIESAGSWAQHTTENIGHDIGKAFSWL